MAKRKNIRIKTKYSTKYECMEKCRDYHGKTRLDLVFIRHISGEVYPDGSFELSSRSRAAALLEFKGKIIEEEDGVYMVGEIVSKHFAVSLLYICTLLVLIVSPLYIYSWGVFGILYMFFILGLLAINFLLMRFSDSLYDEIVRKVC